MLYKYYIGANNSTKRVEQNKAVKIISKYFKGFTLAKSTGYWQGEQEHSITVEIETEDLKTILATAKELCKELKQQAVGVAQIGTMQFITPNNE